VGRWRFSVAPGPSAVSRKICGPVLHVARFSADRLDEIPSNGFGLALGVHSRIEAAHLAARLRAGSDYVSRNQIGAAAGAQPCGGRGLSGTGPKAGGPIILSRYVERHALSGKTAQAEQGTQSALVHARAEYSVAAGFDLSPGNDAGDGAAPIQVEPVVNEHMRIVKAGKGELFCRWRMSMHDQPPLEAIMPVEETVRDPSPVLGSGGKRLPGQGQEFVKSPGRIDPAMNQHQIAYALMRPERFQRRQDVRAQCRRQQPRTGLRVRVAGHGAHFGEHRISARRQPGIAGLIRLGTIAIGEQ